MLRKENFGRLLAVLGLLLVACAAAAPSAHAAPPACCTITSINGATGVVTARVTSTGQLFQFKLSNPLLLRTIRTGQGVFADFRSRRVSLNGRTVVGTITAIGPAPSAPARAPAVPHPSPTNPTPKAAPAANAGTSATAAGKPGSATASRPQPIQIPQLAFGQPQPVQASPIRADVLQSRYTRLHPVGNYTLVHLYGLDGIKMATGIPDGVRDFLYLHARQLPPGELDNYIVNVQLAQQWFAAHPEPDFIKQAATQAMSSGCSSSEHCNAISMECIGKAAEHVGCEAQRQENNVRQQWQADWRHWTGQAEQLWHQAQGCFSDTALNPAQGAFQFSIDPQFPVTFQRSGSTSDSYGKFSGQVTGTATFGVPLSGNFDGRLEMYYIPCLPFAVRPNKVGGNGTLNVGATLDGTLTATGQFQQAITVPPHGVKIPVEVIPVVIGGVPIAELDVSAYLEGNVHLDGQGALNGHVRLEGHEATAYNFTCDGGGCTATAQRVPIPATAAESVQLQGRIHLRPAVYAAVQIDLDWDVLSARAGPEPYLLGELYGCEYAAGSQSTSGATTATENHALTADVDWGVDLRADALAGGKQFWTHNWRMTGGHILFKPLLPSNALQPAVAGSAQAPVGQPAAFTVKMPNCYPYKDQILYRVQWSGSATENGLGATSSGSTSRGSAGISPISIGTKRTSTQTTTSTNCSLQAGEADCWTDPIKNLPFSLDWPAAGTYYLTITPVSDRHGRKFGGSLASQVKVIVQ